MKKKKTKIILVLLSMVLIQSIWWIVFSISNESLAHIPWQERSSNLLLQSMQLFSFAMPFLVFIFYWCMEKKLKEELKLKPVAFNALILGSWIALAIAGAFLIMTFARDYVGYCNPDLEVNYGFFGPCFLSGLEYSIMAFFMFMPAVIILALKMIFWAYKKVTKRTKLELFDYITVIMGIVLITLIICIIINGF